MLLLALATLPGCASSFPLGVPTRVKGGESVRLGDATLTFRVLPKLLIDGPQPEVEQCAIEVTRGAEHDVVSLDSRHRTATWRNYVFELRYADVYQNEIQVTVHAR